MGFVGSYLWQLRQLWGHKLLMSQGVGAVVMNGKGEVLLGLRSDMKEWSHFGGGAEPMQSAQETLLREIEEELGVVPTKYVPFGFLSSPKVTYTVFPTKDELHYWDLNYLVTGWDGELKVGDEEHSEIRFFPLDKLPSPLFKDTSAVLQMLKKWQKTGEFQVN